MRWYGRFTSCIARTGRSCGGRGSREPTRRNRTSDPVDSGGVFMSARPVHLVHPRDYLPV